MSASPRARPGGRRPGQAVTDSCLRHVTHATWRTLRPVPNDLPGRLRAYGHLTRRRRAGDRASWLPLIAVALGYFMVILDATAVNLALPAVSRDLGGGVTGLQWVVNGYTLAFAALLLSAGVAGDRLGSRRVFLTGLATFTAASAGCALAPSLGVLVVIRLIQGVAAAMLVPTSLALLQASYPDPGHPGPRRRAVGRHRRAGRRVRAGARRRADHGGQLAAGVRCQRPGRAVRLVADPPPGGHAARRPPGAPTRPAS